MYANEFNLLSVIKTKADSFTNQGSVQVCGKAVKRGGGLGMEIPIVFTFLMVLGNTWDLLEQLLDVSNNPAIRTEGRGGSRIFIRRWCTRLLLYFNTNKPHIYFFAEYQLYWKTAGHLRRGGVRTPCTLPLDPPLEGDPSTARSKQTTSKRK